MEGNEALNVMTLYVLNCRNLVKKKCSLAGLSGCFCFQALGPEL